MFLSRNQIAPGVNFCYLISYGMTLQESVALFT